MNRYAVLSLATALLNAAEPSWRTPGACTTPTGTLCRALAYESSGWANRSWGFQNIDRYSDKITEAVRSDGAAMLRISHQGFRYYAFPSDSYDRARIILPVRHQTFDVEHSLKAYREMGGVWFFSEIWTDEADCGRRATWAGEARRKTGKEPRVAGIRAVEYVYETLDHRVVQRIAFAPSLGCMATEFDVSERNSAGLPTSERHLRLVSATVGQPPQELFSIPGDYRLVRSGDSWPYVWMNIFPGDITTTGFSKPV